MKFNLKKILLFVFCSCLIFVYTYFFSSLFNDEIWNYGFGYNIASGLVPYRDFNMIITPLYSFVVALFILIFGHHLWVIHVLNALMITMMLFIIYHNIGRKVLLFLAIILLYCYPGYNLFSLFLMIIIISICDKEFKHKDMIMGLLGGVLVLTKQSVGLCMILPAMYYAKNKIKCLFSFVVPVIIFILYLVWNEALFEFIDYCFLGLFDFSNSNKVTLLLPVEILVCIFLVYRLIKSNGQEKKAFYILMYQIITVPICDDYHFMIGFMSVFYYWLEIIQIEKFKIKYYFIILLFTTMCWNYVANGYGKIHWYSNNNSYLYGRYVDKYIEDSITIISDYMEMVKGDYDKVYLFTQNSYQIKMNTSYQLNKYDLINNGNMGYYGNIRYIKEIEDYCLDNRCLFIVYKYEIDDNKLNSNQTNIDIINFIYDNYSKKEDIDVFGIYVS